MVIQKDHLEQIPEGTVVSKSSLSKDKDVNQDSGNRPNLEQQPTRLIVTVPPIATNDHQT